jgi:preprotein translocase subunit SecE
MVFLLVLVMLLFLILADALHQAGGNKQRT